MPDLTDAAPPERDRFRDWPRPFRWVVYALLLVLVLTLAAVGVGTVVVRRPLPTVDGRLTLEGLNAPVDVRRDARGVPQLYADSPGDLFYAQGFVQAQDRFWQMDLRRHVTSGRLSELFGERTVSTDLFIRSMGWRRVAEQELELLSPETRAALESFSDGVNAWLAENGGSRMSLEYSVLSFVRDNYRPEPWTPADSLAWLKAMAWDLAGNYADEIDRARLSVNRDPVQIAELYPSYPYSDNPTVLDGDGGVPTAARTAPRLGRSVVARLGRLGRGLDGLPAQLGTGDGIGSNSWVVSGAHTTTGKPILANDPHLGVELPGALYQMGLHCRTVSPTCPYDVAGFTFAGFPGVVIGHNRDIAWGLTNLKADVTDLYLEKIEGKGYLRGRRRVPLQERDERIIVAGGRDRLLTVRSTVHGPLLSDVSAELSSAGANAPTATDAPERGNGYAVALSWTALTPGRTADAVLQLDRATGWADFTAAVDRLEAPAQSVTYADTDGNIGYAAAGRVPVRRGDRTGEYPAEGWDPGQDWTRRRLGGDQLPRALNPGSGVIVAANQPVTAAPSAQRLRQTADYGFRARRITELLQSRIRAGSALRVGDMTRIQTDTRNPMAPILVPYLLDVLLPSAYDAGGQQLLASWDYRQPADSAAAAYFNAVWRELLEQVFHDQLRESLWPDGSSRWMYVVSQLLTQPENPWWDDAETDDVVENRDLILARVLAEARNEMTRLQARDPARWSWGHLHRLPLRSEAFGDTTLVGRLFNRDAPGAAGGNGAVDATSWDPREGFAVTNAPAMRMVVDLGNLDRSRWVGLAGQSGHAYASSYVDQRQAWLSGEDFGWPWRRDRVTAATTDLLELRPRG